MNDHIGSGEVIGVGSLTEFQQVTATHANKNMNTVYTHKSENGFRRRTLLVRERSCQKDAEFKEGSKRDKHTVPSPSVRGAMGEVIHRKQEAIEKDTEDQSCQYDDFSVGFPLSSEVFAFLFM